jgi:hypothetical protein
MIILFTSCKLIFTNRGFLCFYQLQCTETGVKQCTYVLSVHHYSVRLNGMSWKSSSDLWFPENSENYLIRWSAVSCLRRMLLCGVTWLVNTPCVFLWVLHFVIMSEESVCQHYRMNNTELKIVAEESSIIYCVCVCLVTELHQNICMQNTAHWSKVWHTASMESVIGMFCDSHSVYYEHCCIMGF